MTQPKSDTLHLCAIPLLDARFDFFSSTQFKDDRISRPSIPDVPHIPILKALPAQHIEGCMTHLPQESFTITLGETHVKATKNYEIITQEVMSDTLIALHQKLCQSCQIQSPEAYQPELRLISTKLGLAKKYAPLLKNLPKKIKVHGFMALDEDSNVRTVKLYKKDHKHNR